MRHKLGIIVPYRDRYEQLQLFKYKITKYLDKTNLDYEIIIIEQDNEKLFNRGMLLNIGFEESQRLNCDYVVFHDVDMLPVDVDYSYSEIPLHLSTNFIRNKKEENLPFDEYFGGVTLFPSNIFKDIDGYSNKYWGWGFEDDDLLLRCKKRNVVLDSLEFKYINKNSILELNGFNSYIRCENILKNLNSNYTFFITFHTENYILNHNKDSDTYSIFSIPGYDTAISYNSFLRYNFCTFDRNKSPLYINTKIKKNFYTNIIIILNYDEKKIIMYQDGDRVDEILYDKRLLSYNNQPYFYIGAGDPNREYDNNYFSGYFNKFIIFSECLNDDEIIELSNNNEINKDILLHYDSNYIKDNVLIDLSGNNVNGEIVNCNIVKKRIFKNQSSIPYRRKSKFLLLEHENNGFENNKWKTNFTRYNQLRFYNEVSKNDNLLYNDGLSTLKYVINYSVKNKNITQLNVAI